MKYYIIAGEASGDLHASNLVRELKNLDKEAVIRGWGGDLMRAEGVELVKHYRDTAFMGFLEVVRNLRTIFSLIDFCKKDILSFKPDAVILVDYPGFNLRIAAFTHQNRFKTFYYISPQVWAWKEGRVKKIKQSVDKMFVILPFEKEFYRKRNYETEFVGHPLLDALQRFHPDKDFREKNNLGDKKVIALLPGSRKQEIEMILSIMLKAVEEFNEYEFVIAGLNSVGEKFYSSILSGKNVKVVFNSTYDLLSISSAALVTSGTATLETALFGVPQAVCYRGSTVSFWIGKQLVNVKYISLVNLIMDKQVVKELIQQDCNPAKIKSELNELLTDSRRISQVRTDYAGLKQLLGGEGASRRTAHSIYHALNKM